MAENMNGKDFLIGMLVGSIIGASVAFLMAPKSGRELRQDLSEGYESVSRKTQELARQVGQYSEALLDKVKEMAQQVKEEVQSLTQRSNQRDFPLPHAVDYVAENGGKAAPPPPEYDDLQAKVEEMKREVDEVKRRLEEQQ